MSSINFNGAAVSALRTLQQSNSMLDSTQGRISSGLKIGEAKDNAAYWSISTTLKSDNKALGTVSDALGLGSATVDTAYQGLNEAKNVLDEIKSKLVSASQDGVNKAAIQGEIEELQTQLKAIASASSFSGENWLSVNSAASDYTANKQVVSSFNRNSSGAVTLDTIEINTTSVALIDASTTKEGILDGNKLGNTAINGLTGFANGTVSAAAATVTPAGTVGVAGAGGSFTSTVTINGRTENVNVTVTNAMTVNAFATAFNSALSTAFGSAQATMDTTTLALTTANTGSNQSISINVITAGTTTLTTGVTAGTAGTDNGRKVTGGAWGSTITLDSNDSIDFSVTVDGATKAISVTKAAVDAALGTSDGVINSGANYALVINKAMQQSNVTGITASYASSTIILTAGGATSMTAINATASKGESVLSIDVTTANRAKLTTYINTVSAALSKVTDSASTLGAVSKRIDLQKTFVQNLMDTIDKGVSGLIDADMNEESTKLQALQVKQSLGVQALSIANQSAQNVLRLFQ